MKGEDVSRAIWIGSFILAAMTIGILAVSAAANESSHYNRASAIFPAGNIARGKQLATTCLACHGDVDVALGQPAFHPPRLRYQRLSTIFYALQDYHSGARKSDIMGPIAQAMSEQDMRDLAVYVSARTIRTRMPLRAVPMLADSWAHKKNTEVCGMCHGESGLGEMDGYPALAGQRKDYIEHALMEYRSGGRSNGVMRIFARSLKPDEIPLMAEYFAAQPDLEPVR